MSTCGENFRGGQALIVCPLCHNHLDNQQMALRCEVMNKEVTIKCKIEEIYRDDISLQTAQNLLEVKNTKEQFRETVKIMQCKDNRATHRSRDSVHTITHHRVM
jgi:hypothetical protein